jgi:hypothetical protein
VITVSIVLSCYLFHANHHFNSHVAVEKAPVEQVDLAISNRIHSPSGNFAQLKSVLGFVVVSKMAAYSLALQKISFVSGIISAYKSPIYIIVRVLRN